MRPRPPFLVVVCLFICVCNCAPPVGRKSHVGFDKTKFTDEEDQFIVNELSQIYDGTVSLYTRSLWKKIVEKFNQKRKENTPGFSKERSVSSLRGRFNNVLIYNSPHVNVIVPKGLLQKITDYKRAKGVSGSTSKPKDKNQKGDFQVANTSEPSDQNKQTDSQVGSTSEPSDPNKQTDSQGASTELTADEIAAMIAELETTDYDLDPYKLK